MRAKEHIKGEAAKEHKAITTARVGDGVHELQSRWRRDGSLFCVYIARTVMQPAMQSKEMMVRE